MSNAEKERVLLAALDEGVTTGRAKPGMWDRVEARIREMRERRRLPLA